MALIGYHLYGLVVWNERSAINSAWSIGDEGCCADIPDAKIDAGADGWQKGSAVQLDLKTLAAAR